MRTLAPAETLVYLEASDLGATLQALTENKAWESLAKDKPDFSQLRNTQVAIVVNGFETSEKQITGESSLLNFKPHFAVIADTHQWKPTAVSIAESQIGRFAKETYGDDVKLEKSEKRDAKFFTWTGAGGRKIFAAVSKSVIYVGNDESLLDKCLDVQRGEAENLTKNENLARARENSNGDNQIAFGYISPEGVAQIANIVGVSTAIEASEEDAARSLIARILPNLLQKTTKEIVWTARKTEAGIEDKIFAKTDAETASVLKETLVPAGENQSPAAEFLPSEFSSITRYDLKDPQIAWRSILLASSKQLDPAGAKILTLVSNSFFEPYGVANGEMFLSATGSEIFTARFDEEGEKSVVVATVKDIEKVKKAISEEINFKVKPEKQGAADVWKSEDGDLAVAFVEGKLILGERESVLNCLKARESGQSFAKTLQFQNLTKKNAVAVTITRDSETTSEIVEVLGNPKEENKNYTSFYTTETRFSETGLERKTTSDFGLLGTILEQFGDQK